jgi:hypothetical protein
MKVLVHLFIIILQNYSCEFTIFYIKLKYSFCIYNNMFCNIFSKLFGKKEKDADKIEDKKLEENA